ncbi:MAG: two-component regulator propeller domain-containing protein [Mucilaginibacter sp.]|uniref:hybrid sensor histidine kinase/response regulator n=1 Tax=Mucilaginibacter sp. TaxID=1882438 RepID=UPI00326744A6
MKYRGNIIFLIFLLFNVAGYGQSVSYIGIENGLSNNTVTSIHKDKFGLMWFGTLDGLNRYDGYSFKVFRNKFGDPSSLPNDIINTISSDNSGNIWVGTQKGIGILDTKTLQFSKVTYKNATGQNAGISTWINSVQKDLYGNMYIGATETGLLKSKNASGEAVQIPLSKQLPGHAFHYTVSAIFAGENKKVWVGLDNLGLGLYNPENDNLSIVSKDISSITTICQDSFGSLWLGTKHGLYHYDIKTGLFYKFDLKEQSLNDCNVSGLIFDKKGQLWIATNGEGMIQVEGLRGKTYRIMRKYKSGDISSDALFTIMEDEQSRKWIGTLRGGIDIIDEKKNQFRTYAHSSGDPNSLVNNFTFSFCEDGNHNVWIGTDGGGLSIWNRSNGNFTNYVYAQRKDDVIKSNRIPSIVKDDQNNMWVGTYEGGISKYDAKLKKFEVVAFEHPTEYHSLWRLYKDHRGDIWSVCLRGTRVSGPQRLFKYNTEKDLFISVSFEVKEDILAITDDNDESFWAGGFTGIIHINKKTGVSKNIDLQTAVRSLYKARSGLLWIGTYGRGLFSYNTVTGQFKNYTEENGLCNNKVLNIEEDRKGNIWASTYNGLSKLNPANGKVESFYAVDGLQSNQFYYNASARLSSGELLFGGIKGFNAFNPDSIRQFHDFPPLIISGLRIANSAVNVDSDIFPGAENFYNIDHIRLPYDKAIISLDYVALEYSLPEKIQYAYFLKGRDKNWNNVGNQRTINYSHLNEGDYVLKIRSTNASGFWNNSEKTIYITVLPPWYRTWWAYLSYLILICSAIYGYLFYQKKQTRLKLEVEFVKELNEKKIAFFTNISHELRTPLTLIVNPIKELLHSNGANLDLVDISSVYRNSRRLLSLVDQLLLFRASEDEIAELKPAFLNLKEVCFEVFLCFNNQVKAKNIQYDFECSNDVINIYADREKLEIILFNLLSNAIKYTPPMGTVSLCIKEDHATVSISVKDNGQGIPVETGDRLFDKFYRLQNDDDGIKESGFGIGLFLAKRYTELHKGQLAYTSELGKGTIFTIALPALDPALLPAMYDHYEHPVTGSVLLKELIADTTEAPVNNTALANNDVGDIMGGIVNKKYVILLIDDDLEMRNYVKSLLKDEYIVYEAADTESGYETVQKVDPDIIVCDVVMKGTSGVEFCSRMKESPSFSHIPVILLTGSSSPEIKLKGIECGADDYITKPFESDLLVARIKSMLKGRDTLKNYFFNEITLKNNSQKIPAEFSEFLSKCIKIVEAHLEDETFSIKTFTDEMGMSRSKLFRKIKSISGLSSSEFVRYIRLRKAAELMIQTDMQIKEIAFRIGFQDIKHFREQFNKLFKMNPSEFISKHRKTFSLNHNLGSGIANQRHKH